MDQNLQCTHSAVIGPFSRPQLQSKVTSCPCQLHVCMLSYWTLAAGLSPIFFEFQSPTNYTWKSLMSQQRQDCLGVNDTSGLSLAKNNTQPSHLLLASAAHPIVACATTFCSSLRIHSQKTHGQQQLPQPRLPRCRSPLPRQPPLMPGLPAASASWEKRLCSSSSAAASCAS